MLGPFGLPIGKLHRNLPRRHCKAVDFVLQLGMRGMKPRLTAYPRGYLMSPPRDSLMPHIEIRDVSLVYDTPAGQVTGVQSASFNIEQSEFLCIVGPSGCGKSTLLNLIAGFLEPTGGIIQCGGKAAKGSGQERGWVCRGF